MEEKERMASFIATSNRRYLLCDETGSRRFICVELTHPIDVDTPIDYPQLYAEAMASLERGERCWFDEEETHQLEVHNSAYAASRGVWDLLRQHFEVCEVPKAPDEKSVNLWSASEVYDYLHEISPYALEGIDRHNFGYYLKQIGAQQARLGNRRVYGVKVMD
jgi:predicted P-loop ATPase